MLREALLGVSRSTSVKNLVTKAPVTADVVERFVAGESTEDVVKATRTLVGSGLLATIDHLGEDTTGPEDADRVVRAYQDLLGRLDAGGLSQSAEVSVKLTALGLGLGSDGHQLARENARLICRAAQDVGTTVTVDMEDHTTTDAILEVLAELRVDFPSTAAVLQAYLRRTESDCRDLAYTGSRVRLCKGAYAEPESVAFRDRQEVDRSYVRCMKVLMAGDGVPLLATHDPRMIAIGQMLARTGGRALDSFEFQLLYGIRPTEQQRLADLGHRVRVYIPYGLDWYGYLVRRLAERPANLTFFARSLVSKN